MSIKLGNGKVIISDKTITIKKVFGTEVFQIKEVENISKRSGILYAIWFTIWIITIIRAIPFWKGKYEVTIQSWNKSHTFYLSKEDYQKLQENL